MTNTTTSKKDNNKIYFLLIVVLALFATNGILFFRNQQSREEVLKLSDDKTRMQTEIDKIEIALDKANKDYALLNEDMQKQQVEAREKIAQLREALRRGELTQRELDAAKEEVKQLRFFVDKYVVEIEQLKKQNASLTTERDSLQKTVSSVSEHAKELEQQNQVLDRKVRAAAALKIASIVVTASKTKGNGKSSPVTKAATAKKLDIRFKLKTNEFAEKGLHNVYVRVVDPSGNVIFTDAGSSFSVNGDQLQYSYITALEFANDDKIYVINWENPQTFVKGVYTVTLYADGFSMGSSKITLK